MELVKSIKRNSRGSGKGFAWAIEIETPAVYGSIDAKQFGVIATAETIASIRMNWIKGDRVDGHPAEGGDFVEIGRRRTIEKFVIEKNPDFDSYHEFITKYIEKEIVNKRERVQESRRRKYWIRYRPAWFMFEDFKRRIFKNYRMTVPSGEIGKKSVKSQYKPEPGRPDLYGSGGMVDTLRGKMRTARRAVINGKPVTINQHVDLRVPKNRQETAGWKGGLTQPDTDRLTRSFAHMPQTRAVLENSIRWQNLQRRATNVFAVLRLTYQVARLLS